MSGYTQLILFLTLPCPEAEHENPSKRRKTVSGSLNDGDDYCKTADD
jgi:hypothetical protein